MRFSDDPWETPESALDSVAFCKVCLVDMNAPGAAKIESKCHLPVRRTPRGAYNKAALRNAAARLPVTNIPADAKRKAARRLVKLMRAAGIEPGQATLKTAGI